MTMQRLPDFPELKYRRRIIVGAFMAGAALLVWRATVLQLEESEFLQSRGDARYLRTDQIHAGRGMLLDRNGEPLAISTPTQSAWVRPDIFTRERARWSEVTAPLGVSVEQLDALVTPRLKRRFVYVRRQMDPAASAAVMKLGLSGLEMQTEYRRYYPNAEMAAHVVGFTNVDDQGQEGAELSFDTSLRGEPGLRRVIKDNRGRIVEDVERLRPVRAGQDLYLSIDQRVQYVAYRELKAAVFTHKARAGTVVILDPWTGEILALVNQPSFNPNNRDDYQVERYRNRAVTDLFEPGSTIKPFTVAIALESGLYSPDSPIETAPGFFKVGRHTVRDIHNYGTLDVAGVIAKSSNVGASKIALSLEPERLWHGFYSFGFGSQSAIELPGETLGRLNDYGNWSEIEHATLAFGYGLSVTAVQLARAYGALANGGWLLPVSVTRAPEATFSRQRVVEADTAAMVRAMLEQVILRGTGKAAGVPGYSVAGKTGTVHKSIETGYAEERYLSLFAGMIPARQPRLVAVVVLDEPRDGEYYGGRVAAPVFSAIMREATRILDIPSDVPLETSPASLWLAGHERVVERAGLQ